MKSLTPFLTSYLCVVVAAVNAQNVSLTSQNLSGFTFYNPAATGQRDPSAMYSFTQFGPTQVEGSRQQHVVTFQTPLTFRANARKNDATSGFGIGVNVFQQRIAFLNDFQTMFNFSYAIALERKSSIAFGLGTGYRNLHAFRDVNFSSLPDNEIAKFMSGVRRFDFSFGTHYRSEFIECGIALNNMGSSWLQGKFDAVLSNYISMYAQKAWALRGERDIVQLGTMVRKTADDIFRVDIGGYYTIDEKLMLGLSTSNGRTLCPTVAFTFPINLRVAYSFETMMKTMDGAVNGRHEVAMSMSFTKRR